MATYYWELDDDTLSTQQGVVSGDGVASKRGDSPIKLVVMRTGVPVQLPAGHEVGVCMRDPAALKQGYLAGPLVLSRGATPGDGYTNTFATDTTAVRNATHALDSDPAPETPAYLAEIAFYYVPAGGAPVESLSLPWMILAPDYRPGTPPSDIVVVWPTPTQLSTAVAQAAAAEPGLGNPAHDGSVLSSTAAGARSWLVTTSSGIAAGYVVVLDPSGRLPALDGRNLVNVPASVDGQAITPASVNTTGSAHIGGSLIVDGDFEGSVDPDYLSAPVSLILGGTGVDASTTGGKATARANLGAAASGANTDLTSLGAVTSISAGGTGNRTITLTPTGAGVLALAGNATVAGTLAVTGAITAPNLAPYHNNAVAPSVTASSGAVSTLSISGKDTGGLLTLSINEAISDGTLLGTITFGTSFGAAPLAVQLTPADGNANLLAPNITARVVDAGTWEVRYHGTGTSSSYLYGSGGAFNYSVTI